ncbi:peptide MFS transporter [Mycolicibacterium litorale]|uniref:peptide MFS transporter n=1 Tax=Mycolicibacterium litorale TaxID=758802 RepID=UPI0016296791|nr:oligopeptide:H+ symporter [Mycolicibacterium litorale]
MTPASLQSAARQPGRVGLLTQPPRFWNLAFTDLWERFSFYSLQALLSYYLLYDVADGGLAVSAAVVAGVVGTYGALAQLAQIVGSWMADRLVAPKKLVLYGGSLIALGHISLGILPGFVGLFVGLGLIIVGTGALKTNLAAILGILYDADPTMEPRRDAGFTIYLAATNTGVVIGPLLAGLAQTTWGFHAGFAVAAVGMFLGLAQYCLVYKRLPVGAAQVVRPLPPEGRGTIAKVVSMLVVVAVGLYFTGALDGENLATTVGIVVVVVIITYYTVMLRSKAVTAEEKTRLRGLSQLSAAGLVFYGFQFLIFTTVPLFVTDSVDLAIGGWEIPPAWFVSASAVGSIAASPFVSALWNRMGIRQPSAMSKNAVAFALSAIGFLILGLAAQTSTTVPALLVLGCLIVLGIAEVFLGPLLFAMGSKCMPVAFRTQGLAIMSLSIGGGSVLAGIWGGIYTHMSSATFFLTGAAVCAVIAGVLRLAAPANHRAVSTFE